MSQNEIAAAARAICEEKGIALEAVVEAIESALAAAYRKDFGEKNQNIKVEFDLETAKSKVYDEKTVVEDMLEELEEEDGDDESADEKSKAEENKKEVKSKKLKVKSDPPTASQSGGQAKDAADGEADEEEERKFNPRTELQISDAKKIKKTAKVGDVIKTKLEVPSEYGRMAAQTAKQVIIQRIREVERANLFDEFKGKEHEVVTGIVQRREGRVVLVDLGRTNGILTADGQAPGERYDSGQRIKVYIEEVRTGAKGPEIILSRTSPEVVRKIFMLEIPEISNGLVEIKAVSREAGFRTKIAVTATEENIDPIGSCVGQRGARISTIISELSGEKIDIIEWSEDAGEFIANALAPAKVLGVDVDEKSHIATAKVSSDQLSLAIGKGGQNVRLAARLVGWKIDVKEVKGGSKKEEVGSEKSEDGEEKEEVTSNQKLVASEDENKDGEKKDDNSEQQIVNPKPSGGADKDEKEEVTSNKELVTSEEDKADDKKEKKKNKKKESAQASGKADKEKK